MAQIKITFPDGSKKSFKKGITALEIAKSISEGLARKVLAAKIDGEVKDATIPINKDAKLKLLTFKDKEGKEVFWHSASHLMSQAVLRVFKEQTVGLGVGMPVDEGFYQDYGLISIHQEDLEKIEKEMKKIVEEKLDIKRREIPKKEALEFYKKDPYKIELIKAVPGKKVTMYKQGEYDNLCKGPHIPNTSLIKAFKLMKVAGAYWRGDSNNDQLQRIYGVAFPDKKELRKYLQFLEEAKKRDHRVIGKDLEWFQYHEYSPGSPFFHEKGTIIYNELLQFIREEYRKRGYKEVITPLIYDKALWETSGHWEHYKEDVFTLKVDDREFALKPMNCPSHCLMYLNKTKSYRDLPIRIADFAPLHRNELKGVLGGLTRVRKFSQDDSHIFCTEDQIQKEIEDLFGFVDFVFTKTFGMEFHLELSTRPEKAMGSKKFWDKSEKVLEDALKKNKMKYKINPGDGAFYGPKIDIHVKDCLGRNWQCATIQLDLNLPERFNLQYEGQDGKKHRPVMIHRAILGSLERFMGIMIEHFAGKLPLWLSPEQARILTVSDKYIGYGEKILAKMRDKGIRAELDDRTESIGKKVREAQLEKVNYILVVGEKEEKTKTVSVRTFHNKVLGAKKTDDFINAMLKEIKEKRN